MPIECAIETKLTGQEQFHAVDKMVMRHAFDLHNTLGRFCDERIYKDELALRCRADGYEVHQEVPLKVSFQDFSKQYFVDLLLERGLVYELKTVEVFNSSHESQLINYLLLTGLQHGKLINFRPGSVASRFVSTSLIRQDRMTFHFSDDDEQADESSQRIRETLRALFSAWGAFLDINLYREALLHFLNDREAGIQPVQILVDGHIAGMQKMCMLNAQTAWHLSSVRDDQQLYEAHLMRLLSHTRLKRLQWININHRLVTFRTLKQ